MKAILILGIFLLLTGCEVIDDSDICIKKGGIPIENRRGRLTNCVFNPNQ